jgi:hypothetical protein
MKYEKFVIDWQKRLKKALQRVYNYEDLDNFIASVIEATKLKYNNLCPNCYDVLEPNASPLRVKIKFIYRGEEYPRRIKIEEDYEELEVIIPEMNDEYFLARIDSGGNYKLLETISSDKVEIKANPLDAQVIPQGELSLCERYGHAMYSVYVMDNYATGGSSKWGENKCSRCGYTDTWQYDK